MRLCQRCGEQSDASACPACGFTTFIEVAGPPPAEPEAAAAAAPPARPVYRRALLGVSLLLLPLVCYGYSRLISESLLDQRSGGGLALAAAFLGLISAVFVKVCLWPCLLIGLWILYREFLSPPTIKPPDLDTRA